MADNFRRRPRFAWQKWLLIATGILLTLGILIIPLGWIFVTALSDGIAGVMNALSAADTQHAIWLTLIVALITVPVNLIFGTLLAWLVTRFRFPGRQLLLTLADLPFAVSPVIAGLLYLLLYGANGWLGSFFENDFNTQIMFALPGIVLVTLFVTCPYVVRELVPVMLSQGAQEEEAAVLLGASAYQIWWRITLPNIRWPLFYGVILTNARAIGEFGAVSVVSGAIRGETFTLPLQVELLHQDYQTVAAFTAAGLLALMAVVTLFIRHGVSWYLARRALSGRHYEH